MNYSISLMIIEKPGFFKPGLLFLNLDLGYLYVIAIHQQKYTKLRFSIDNCFE
jgi:hypothetical protein